MNWYGRRKVYFRSELTSWGLGILALATIVGWTAIAKALIVWAGFTPGETFLVWCAGILAAVWKDS